MSKKNVWTTPHTDGWANKTEGASRPSGVFPTKAAAVEAGKSQAQRNHSEHIIQKGDGKIQEKNSYGSDPLPPKDQR